MSARTLILVLLILWALFAILTFTLRPDEVFHYLDAIAVSGALTVMWSYAPGVLDAWRHREHGISDGQLLAIGVFAIALGLIVRLSRWYFTHEVPTHGGLAAWSYNVGLWVSVCASALLVAALATSEPRWSWSRVVVHLGTFIVVALVLLHVDFAF